MVSYKDHTFKQGLYYTNVLGLYGKVFVAGG